MKVVNLETMIDMQSWLRLRHPMDLPCKNKNFSGNAEKLAKVLGAEEEA